MSVSSYVHAPSSSARLHFCLLGHTAEAVWLPGVETFMFHFKTMLMPEMSAIHSVSSSSRDSSGGWKSSSFFVKNLNFNCRLDNLGKHIIKVKTHFWLLSRQLPPHEKAGPSLIWSAAPEPCDLPQNCWTFSLANEPWTKVSSECTLRKVNKPGDKLQACIMEQKTSRATGARFSAWKCAGASFLKGNPLDGCFKVAQECC